MSEFFSYVKQFKLSVTTSISDYVGPLYVCKCACVRVCGGVIRVCVVGGGGSIYIYICVCVCVSLCVRAFVRACVDH